MHQPLGAVMQMAYVVENLEEAIQQWAGVMKAGPFTVIEHFEIENMRYRGNPCDDLEIRLALGNSGGICIEFIEQKSATPSVYKEVIDKRGYGFHHCAIMVDQFDKAVENYQSMGYRVCFSGKVSIGERYVYLDSHNHVHNMIEVIEYSPQVDQLFTGIEVAASEWDGKDVIRYL